MATRTISTRVAIDGEAQYRNAVKNINNEIRLMQSNLKAVESEYRNSANTTEALTAKVEALSAVYQSQSDKVDRLKEGLSNAQSALEAYQSKSDELTAAIEANNTAMEELQNSSGDTSEEEARLAEETANLQEQLEENNERLEAAQRGVNDWQRDLNNATVQLNETSDELDQFREYLDQASESADGCTDALDEFGNAADDAGDATDEAESSLEDLADLFMAGEIIEGVKKVAESFLECAEAYNSFESAMAGVQKTTDLTAEELDEMGRAFQDLSTEIPMTAEELAGIAENAGQLGIEKENLLTFTQTMADLGTATNLTGEEAAQTFAKFANITGMAQEDFPRLGSAIVDLGNNFATTEADIADMSQNLAAAGTQANMTEGDILGIATALSSVGMEAQAGGTAFSKIITEMTVAVETGSDRLDEFAEVAGMSAEEFRRAFEEDAAGALVAFIEGLGNAEEKGSSASVILEDLGLTEVRLSDSLKRAASSGDLFRNAIEQGNTAWEENNALTKEAETRYGTTESKLQMMQNAFGNLKVAIGEQLNPIIQNFADLLTDAAKGMTDFFRENEGAVPVIAAIAGAVGAFAISMTLFSAAGTIATKVVEMFNAVCETNPIFLIVSGIAAATAAIVLLCASYDDGIERTKELTEATRDAKEELGNIKVSTEEAQSSSAVAAEKARAYADMLRELEATGLNTAESQNQYKLVVDQLNQIMPELNLQIDEQTGLIDRNIESVYADIDAWEEYYFQKALLEQYNDVFEQHGIIKAELLSNETKLLSVENDLAVEIEKQTQLGNDWSDAIARQAELKANEINLTSDEADELARLNQELPVLEAAYNTQSETVATLQAQQTELTGAIEIGNEALAEADALLGEAKEEMHGVIDAAAETTGAADGANEAYLKMCEGVNSLEQELNQLEEDYNAAYDAARASIDGQVGVFKEFAEGVSTSSSELLGSMQNSIDNLGSYTENLATLSKLGFSDGLVKAFSDGSPEAVGAVKSIIDEISDLDGGLEGNSKEVQDYVKNFNDEFDKLETTKDKFTERVAKMETEFDSKAASIESRLNELTGNMDKTGEAATAANNTVQGFINVMNNRIGEFRTAGQAAGNAYVEGYKSASKIKSPSKKMAEMADFTIQGFTNEIERQLKDIEELGADMANAFNGGVKEDIEMNILTAMPRNLDFAQIDYNSKLDAIISALDRRAGSSASPKRLNKYTAADALDLLLGLNV